MYKLYNQLQNHEELCACIYFLQLFVLFQMLARSHVDILVGDQTRGTGHIPLTNSC